MAELITLSISLELLEEVDAFVKGCEPKTDRSKVIQGAIERYLKYKEAKK